MGKPTKPSNTGEELHAAARSGDLNAVKSICSSNPLAINSRDKHSRTPYPSPVYYVLCFCIKCCSISVIQYFLAPTTLGSPIQELVVYLSVSSGFALVRALLLLCFPFLKKKKFFPFVLVRSCRERFILLYYLN